MSPRSPAHVQGMSGGAKLCSDLWWVLHGVVIKDLPSHYTSGIPWTLPGRIGKHLQCCSTETPRSIAQVTLCPKEEGEKGLLTNNWIQTKLH